MIKLVIFDLDGTLLDTLSDLANSCNHILAKNNYPQHEKDAYRYFVGSGVNNLIKRALKDEERTTEKEANLVKEFIAYYNLHSEEKTSPYPGTGELLANINRKNIKISIASNKFISATRQLVSKYFETIEFASVLGQREGVAVKPDPQIVYDILTETKINEKSEILYIGDSGVDMQTAKNAGITSIGVLWGFRTAEELKENGADYLVSKAAEILDIINEINSKENKD